MQIQYVNVNGIQTRCLTAGDPGAPPLLLVHGLALTAEVWVRNIATLASAHRVVALDMLGHGFTRPPEGSLVDFDAKLDHISALLDVLGFERVSLCGSSYGALICALTCLREPERVDRLIISGSGSCFNTADQLHDQIKAMNSVFDPVAMQNSTRQEWRTRVGKNFHNTGKIPEELLLAAQMCYAQGWPSEHLAETLLLMGDREAVAPYRILERLEDLRCPTRVFWGREDHGGNLESARQAVQRIPDGRIEVFDRCGHYPMLEHPDRFNAMVLEFLEETGG